MTENFGQNSFQTKISTMLVHKLENFMYYLFQGFLVALVIEVVIPAALQLIA